MALLQETCTLPDEVLNSMELSPYTPWLGEYYYINSLRPPRVVRTSDRVNVEWYEQVGPHRGRQGPRQMPVSGISLCDAAGVTPVNGGDPVTVVSMYAAGSRLTPTLGRDGFTLTHRPTGSSRT